MRGIVRRVVASLRRHLLMIILGTLVLLAIFVVLWRFPAWLTAPAPPVQHAAQLAGVRILDVVAVLQQHLILVGALGLGLGLWSLSCGGSRNGRPLACRRSKTASPLRTPPGKHWPKSSGESSSLPASFSRGQILNVAQENIKITQKTATKNLEISPRGANHRPLYEGDCAAGG